jgi:nitrite reductase/ring-hydroxylating ferredoxin subunit/CheY-like chemotaxis protein
MIKMANKQIILMIQNPILRRRLTHVVEAANFSLAEVTTLEMVSASAEPMAIVVELELPDIIDAISKWKSQWPHCFIAAAIALPDQELWVAANAAGCDLVANRGALPNQLQKRLAEHQTGDGLIAEPIRLEAKRITNEGDGLVGRVPDAPDGSIVIFRVNGRYHAIRDVCPHAGYSLADGELNENVITCPQHGSRFDVCTGERVRGPSDYPIQTYKALEENGKLFIEIPQQN